MRGTLLASVALAILTSSCAVPSEHGMVRQPASAFQYGSTIERNIVIDPAQFKDRTFKVTIRNTSGDVAYQVPSFSSALTQTLVQKGYSPAGERFGLLVDVNVLYSGHVQRSMIAEYGFLGAAAGGLGGYRSNTRGSVGAGMLAGATLGSIIGSYDTTDTYIVVAEVSIGVFDVQNPASSERVITFSSSPSLQRERMENYSPFRQVLRTKVAVYGGGRNATQGEVAPEVRRRLMQIVSDVI